MASQNKDGGSPGDTKQSAYDKKHGQSSGTSGKQKNSPDVPHPRSKSRSDAPIKRDKRSK